jgi:hypothetical protein
MTVGLLMVRYEFLRRDINVAAFWEVLPCCQVEIDRHFRELTKFTMMTVSKRKQASNHWTIKIVKC